MWEHSWGTARLMYKIKIKKRLILFWYIWRFRRKRCLLWKYLWCRQRKKVLSKLLIDTVTRESSDWNNTRNSNMVKIISNTFKDMKNIKMNTFVHYRCSSLNITIRLSWVRNIFRSIGERWCDAVHDIKETYVGLHLNKNAVCEIVGKGNMHCSSACLWGNKYS